MSKIQAVSKEVFQYREWLAPDHYGFASEDTVIGLGINEFARAMSHISLGFVEDATGYFLVAIQGFEQGQNLFVNAEGKWLGGYLPQFYQFYPFKMAKKNDTENVLCVDTDSGLVVEAGGTANGRAFFNEAGPTDAIRKIFSDMLTYEDSIAEARKVCTLLKELDLIEPWPLSITQNEDSKKVSGFFRINENALNKISAVDLVKLRDCGALALCYAQLFSMQKISQLGALASGSSLDGEASNRILSDSESLDFFERDEAISFENI